MDDRKQESYTSKENFNGYTIPIVICVFLVSLVGAVFGQTVRFDFINYDDDRYIYQNPTVVRGLDPEKIVYTFIHFGGREEWLPITEISHMVDWQFYGPHAGGHHLTNVLLHAATAIFLFLTLWKMTDAMWRSAFVSAVFAIHPLRVESVAWVTERKDVLSGLFFVLTLWMWVRYVRTTAGRPEAREEAKPIFDPDQWNADYYLALAFFALGIMSKGIVVTIPFLLLLLDYWPLNRLPPSGINFGSQFRIWAGLILEKAPFFLLSFAGCVATIIAQPHVVSVVHGLSYTWRFGNASMAYVDYLGHMVYPAGLALLYGRPPEHLPIFRVGCALGILIGASLGALVARRRDPYLFVGWFWYLGVFVPVIDTLQAGDQSRADRYTYLPQIGLYILIAWGVAELWKFFRFRQAVLATGTALVVVLLSVEAYAQTTYWKNSVTLWTHTLAHTPRSYIDHCNLGIALADEGKQNEAVEQFNQALEINTNDAKSINNLGKVLTSEGKLDEAIQDFHRSLQLDSDDPAALDNLAVALAAQGKQQEAFQDFDKATRLNPNDAEIYYNLGNTLTVGGDLDGAVENYEQALQINPDFAEAHCNLGLVLVKQGNLDEAVNQYEQAIQIKPHYLGTLNNLGGVLLAQGDLPGAAQYYEQALQLESTNLNTLNNLGVVYARQKNFTEAIQSFREALQIKPDDAATHNNLGIALMGEGKPDEATQEFQEALDLARGQNNIDLENSVRKRLETIRQQSQ